MKRLTPHVPHERRLATAALLRKHGAKPTPQSAAELDRAQFGSDVETDGGDEEADGSDGEADGSAGGSEEAPPSEAGSEGGEEDAAAQLGGTARREGELAEGGGVAEVSETGPARSQVRAAVSLAMDGSRALQVTWEEDPGKSTQMTCA